MRVPRILVLIGSGETTRTLTPVHRRVLARSAVPVREGVAIDTPYGFQENADELSERIVSYFRDQVGVDLRIASVRGDESGAERAGDDAVAPIRRAPFTFSGPGSPSYVLRHWRLTPLPDVLRRKLTDEGGIVVLASAAALTAGVVTAPIYEMYKAGADPHWLPGLDLLACAGLHAAVIPHYDNAEGGTHDTRFCFLGERRLRILERMLPSGASILGIDERTALVLDLDAGDAEVMGAGGVTVRVAGESAVYPSGSRVPIAALHADRPGDRPGAAPPGPGVAVEYPPPAPPAIAPFVEALLELRARARAAGDYATSDEIRRWLLAAGVEVRDGGDGPTWRIRERRRAPRR